MPRKALREENIAIRADLSRQLGYYRNEGIL